ncbi:MAG: glycoside hydrolase/phage tail family protein [Acidobacteria bacterium]|nr:glycoside hydrolase/phage tail family protein [Acidobacteriota bacterium]
MAQIILSQAGAAIGQRLLPQGVALLGRTITGAAIGRAVGSLAGQAIDGYFAAPVEGPRVKALHVMGAAEGEGIASVYGRMRVGGQLIWASRFTEHRTTRRTGGKGGQRVETARYTVSLAVALGEGPVQRVSRAWANGEPFDLSGVQYRFYPGTEMQEADPLIEMIEGDAPAYRGVAYLVFEDLPLDTFGDRIPQLSFEVLRSPGEGETANLAQCVTGVNIIPATGEFVYATEIVRELAAPGEERPLNVHTGEARADFLVSLDQLREDLPRAEHVALTAGWFASGLEAGTCEIRPGVETPARVTRPHDWSVAGESRAAAYVVSQDEQGRVNYGGTPSDHSVRDAIAELRTRGYQVTLTPFLLVDAPGFPWRGRITVEANRTAGARTEIDAFMLGANGYRRFILHYAQLAADAGGVDAFLVGSEMRGLTRVRDEAGAFPFVEALCALADEVKAILPEADVSYAADWTEYGTYVPEDASGDVLFPLDAFWAHDAVGFVGIDWYPPMGDWRDGENHLDRVAGFQAADDADYLAAQLQGGEAYDWYYASDEHRAAQVRTPIIDTAHGEDWVFRAKDLAGWAGALHYPRPGGVRAAVPTAWEPGVKPLRFSEIGFAAVDKAGNAPNLFFDPKSTESGLPPFSTGARDDVMQARLLAAALGHFEAGGHVESAHVWAWDARPFPAWPLRADVWGDGANWARGHWLNGRSGLAPLAEVVAAICAAGGVEGADTRALDGLVEGYVLDGVSSVRAALEPLQAAFNFEVVERPGGLAFRMADDAVATGVASGLISDAPLRTRQLMDKSPARLRLTCIDPDKDHEPMVAEARRSNGDARLVADLVLPLALSQTRAEAVAAQLLARSARTVSAEIVGGPALAMLEPGDLLRLDDETVWRIEAAVDAGTTRTFTLAEALPLLARTRSVSPGAAPGPAPVFPEPDLVVIDAPAGTGIAGDGPLVAAFSDPWPGALNVLAGPELDDLRARAWIEVPAIIGRLRAPVGAGVEGRWDKAGVLEVTGPVEAWSSLPAASVLAGGNAALLETVEGWELVQFREAELTGPDCWRLTGLLRGQGGSVNAAADVGARLVRLDTAVVRADVSALERGAELIWTTPGAGSSQTAVFEDRAQLPWRPCHLRVKAGMATWIRRGSDVADSWTFPEALSDGRFALEFDFGSGFEGRVETPSAACAVPPGTLALRVAGLAPDGRTGPWLSIGPGSPYL